MLFPFLEMKPPALPEIFFYLNFYPASVLIPNLKFTDTDADIPIQTIFLWVFKNLSNRDIIHSYSKVKQQ